MKLDCALLCDAVSIREGLLHILGGGITRTTNASYPAEFDVALAMRILLHQTEAGIEHSLQVILLTEDGKRLVEMNGGFRTELPPTLAPGEALAIPFTMAFQGPLPQPGTYSFEILIDNVHQVTVPLRAVTPE